MNIHTIELSPKIPLREYRHPTNKNLLCRATWKWQIEIYDKKSRQTIYTWPSRKNNDVGLKGSEFQNFARDLRCPSCSRLLCRWLGYWMVVEIKCTHCKEVHAFRMKNLYDISFKSLPKKAQENLLNTIKSLTF